MYSKPASLARKLKRLMDTKPNFVQARGVGRMFTSIGLPSITGFIATGIICGPYTLNIVEKHDLAVLSYINMFALAYITTSAGAELVIEELKPTIKAIVASVTAVSFLTFGVCTGVTYGLADSSLLAPLMSGKDNTCQSSISLVNRFCMHVHALSDSLDPIGSLKSLHSLPASIYRSCISRLLVW
jgi:hypothetical protein